MTQLAQAACFSPSPRSWAHLLIPVLLSLPLASRSHAAPSSSCFSLTYCQAIRRAHLVRATVAWSNAAVSVRGSRERRHLMLALAQRHCCGAPRLRLAAARSNRGADGGEGDGERGRRSVGWHGRGGGCVWGMRARKEWVVRAYALGGLKRRANDRLVGLAVDGGTVEAGVLKVGWGPAILSGGGLVGARRRDGVEDNGVRSGSRSPARMLSPGSPAPAASHLRWVPPYPSASSLPPLPPSRPSSFSLTYAHPLSRLSRGALPPATPTHSTVSCHTSPSRSRSPLRTRPRQSSVTPTSSLPLALSHLGRYVLEWLRCVRVCVCLRRWAGRRAALLATRSRLC